MGYLLPFFFVLLVVVFIHEMGHFLVGRWCGVKVEAFSIGFGPEIAGWTDKKGTRWRLAALPLGGYVKFFGDANAASVPDPSAANALSPEERALTLAGQEVWKRAAIVAAGPIANFLLAIAIFSGNAYVYGDNVVRPVVAKVVAGGAAEKAGFLAGDLVISIDGRPIDGFAQLQDAVSLNPGSPLRIVVRRADADVALNVTPELRTVEVKPFGPQKFGVIGVQADSGPGALRHVSFGPVGALGRGLDETWGVVARTGVYLRGLVAGRQPADQISGPIGVGAMAGAVAKIGFGALLSLVALFSVSIGLMNLMPIPMLDGGHLLYYAIEGVRGRPLSERSQEIGFRIGLAFVALVFLFATSNDLFRLVPRLFGRAG
ncbi:MAG: RIP metalloprotease RseP [Hyphomicrobiales bacterium]|nr:RIP metalloprotease RseP [Hyphomicrobiales bacterium]MDE2016554.1 RIP metalloprotease RseP [Hyphomicrobiales bacterium]